MNTFPTRRRTRKQLSDGCLGRWPSGFPAGRPPGAWRGLSGGSADRFRARQSQYLLSFSSRLATPSLSFWLSPLPPRQPPSRVPRAHRGLPCAQARAASHLRAAGAGRPPARRGAHASPPARAGLAAAGAGGGGAGAGLRRGPAQPRPAPPSGPPLRLAALSRRAPPPAPLSVRLGPREPPRLPGLEGCVGSRQWGGATPPRGGGFAPAPGPATNSPCAPAGRAGGRERGGGAPPLHSAARPAPPPPLPRSSSSPTPRGLAHPAGGKVPPSGRTEGQAGREGAAAGTRGRERGPPRPRPPT